MEGSRDYNETLSSTKTHVLFIFLTTAFLALFLLDYQQCVETEIENTNLTGNLYH